MHSFENRPHADLASMQATAAWQAAFGVTEFTLYYDLDKLPPGDAAAYTRYIGRLYALLREATPEPQVLLYYPIRELWAEFHPVAEPVLAASQSPAAQRIARTPAAAPA